MKLLKKLQEKKQRKKKVELARQYDRFRENMPACASLITFEDFEEMGGLEILDKLWKDKQGK